MLEKYNNRRITPKQFKVIKIVVAMLVASSVAASITYQNYLIPIVVVGIASLIIIFFKGKVEGVLADERDYEVAGKSALLAIQIFGWISMMGMFYFLSAGYEVVAYALAYSVCGLMILYAFIFRFYGKIVSFEKKIMYILAISVLLVAVILFGVSLL